MGKKPIEIWQEKLEFLRKEEAIASDPSKRFQLKKEIEEIQEKIAQLKQEEKESAKPSNLSGSNLSNPNDSIFSDFSTRGLNSRWSLNRELNPKSVFFDRNEPSTARLLPQAHLVYTINFPDRLHSVAFSSDSRKLATGTWDTVWIWDTSTKRELRAIHGEKGPAFEYVGYTFKVNGKAVTFLHDNSVLATGGTKYQVLLWNLETGEVFRDMEGHKGYLKSLALSPDGWRLASASSDGTAKVWKTNTGYEEYDLWGHEGDVNCVAFSVKGDVLATGSEDNTVRLWNAYSGSETKVYREYQHGVSALVFSPDGILMATAGVGGIKLWDYKAGRVVKTLDGSWSCVAFSPDGELLAYGQENSIIIYHAESGQVAQTLSGHEASVTCLAFSPNGKLLVSGSEDRSVKFWEIIPP